MLQLIIAIWIAKLIFFVTRFFKLGGGSAAPGLYALMVDPDLVAKLASQIPQNIVITGTNGKTTTARLLNHLVVGQKIKTLRNSTGSNLERGIASALLSKVNLLGRIKNVEIGIWELDEAAFNTVLFKLKPELIVFLNAFRDQLDRYGEVDSVKRKWQEALLKVDWNSHMIINEGDYTVAPLADLTDQNPRLTSSFFKIRGHSMFQEATLTDPLHSDRADFEGKVIKNLGLKGEEIELLYPGGKLNLTFPIAGVYQIYNLLAAFSVYYALNLPLDEVENALKGFKPAFGRVEEVKIDGIQSYIFLIKNPAGANNVFETISSELTKNDILLTALNDNFADGKDVSWIWDAEWEQLIANPPPLPDNSDVHWTSSGKRGQHTNFKIITSGTRAYDLAVRLKYAAVETGNITTEHDLNSSLDLAVKMKPKRIFILPTYTALLELQNILAKRGVKKDYWKEE